MRNLSYKMPKKHLSSWGLTLHPHQPYTKQKPAALARLVEGGASSQRARGGRLDGRPVRQGVLRAAHTRSLGHPRLTCQEEQPSVEAEPPPCCSDAGPNPARPCPRGASHPARPLRRAPLIPAKPGRGRPGAGPDQGTPQLRHGRLRQPQLLRRPCPGWWPAEHTRSKPRTPPAQAAAPWATAVGMGD